MRPIRFVMLGGFLGAGKTTAITRLAQTYQARGQRVGVVTNDQAQNLVDTNLLRSQGLTVEEVPGACFCCRFDALMGRDLQPQRAVSEVCERAILCLPASLPVHHAAAQAAALDVVRVIAVDGRKIVGLAGGLDLAALVAL